MRRCSHINVRCIHGDEIIAVGYRRSQCFDCDRFLKPLPGLCSVTGELHPSAEWFEDDKVQNP